MRILLVDDEDLSRESIADFLGMAMGHEIVQAIDGEEALSLFKEKPFPIVITDLKMPGMHGIDLLSTIRRSTEFPDTNVIIMTGFADYESAISALREGAHDYLEKPVDVMRLSRLIADIERDRASNEVTTEHSVDNQPNSERGTNAGTSESQIHLEVSDVGTVVQAAQGTRDAVQTALKLHDDRSLPVLIQGDTGTGKEVIAKIVHHGLGKSSKPFVSVNCSAIPASLFESELFGYEEGAFTGARKGGNPGKFEMANGGTLFLDEIGDLPLEMQPKLLRVLQERDTYRVGGSKSVRLDVRIIAATNRPLRELVEEKRFRQDLLYRLEIGTVRLLPLKDRREDIFPLAQYFLLKTSEDKKRKFRFIEQDAKAILTRYSWPGNIRELKNVIDRTVLLNDEVSLNSDHLAFIAEGDTGELHDPSGLIRPGRLTLPEKQLNLNELEAEILRKALRKYDGNQVQTAKYLGISRNTLRTRMKNWNIS
jgi:two-component system, NtrC family, response regulator AtoC